MSKITLKVSRDIYSDFLELKSKLQIEEQRKITTDEVMRWLLDNHVEL